MLSRLRLDLLLPVVVLAILSCDDDDNPIAGNPDTTPPAIAAVTAIDINHIEVTFNETVDRTSADNPDHYAIVDTTPLVPSAAPEDTLAIVAAVLMTDGRTVTITTGPMMVAPYTLMVEGVKDTDGNSMSSPVVVPFAGTIDPDVTPPEIVASIPPNGAVNVDLDTRISISFSEPMTAEYLRFVFVPDGHLNQGVWDNDGRTWETSLATPLADNVQYWIGIRSYSGSDLAGNELMPYSIHFSTGNSLLRGGISGKVVVGGNDAAGAYITTYDSHGDTQGWDVSGSDGAYELVHLHDDTRYYVHAFLEANGNPDDLDPSMGDAFGAYGADLPNGDLAADTITVSGAVVTNRDFPITDVSAIAGHVVYEGMYSGDWRYQIVAGIFSVETFDPDNPDAVTIAIPEFSFVSYFDMPPTGKFYLGAYVDVDNNDAYDAGIDPVGFYGGDSLIELTIANGSDIKGIVFEVEDPVLGARRNGSSTSSWRVPKSKPHDDLLDRISKAARDAVKRHANAQDHARP